MPIKVSVILMTYNQEHTIRQAIESVIAQDTNFEYELLIGEDHSLDSTRQICEEFLNNKKVNVSLFEKTENVGIVRNFKRLFNIARGQYIALLAGDDYWIDSEKLMKQVEFLDKNIQFGMVHTGYQIFNVNKQEIEIPNNTDLKDIDFKKLLKRNPISAISSMILSDIIKKALLENIIKDEFGMEDYPLWLYTSEKYKIGFIEDVTSVYRKYENSASNFSITENAYKFKEKVLLIKLFFAKRNNMMSGIKYDFKDFYSHWINQSIYNSIKAPNSLLFYKFCLRGLVGYKLFFLNCISQLPFGKNIIKLGLKIKNKI